MAPPPDTPVHHHTGALTNSRFQSDLKPLIQLEVADLVFESSAVPSLFFGTRDDLSTMIPTEDEARPFIDALVHCTTSPEKHAYGPLEDLLNFIVNPPKASVRHGRKKLCVLFRVYTKVMDNAYDGRGKLKPDLLCGDRERIQPLPHSDPRVHWRVVWMSLEVKALWPEALQQVLTYARSMLEVGDKWYALVLVYNHSTSTIRLCFATRHAVFVTPSWDIATSASFELFSSALLHACDAYTESARATTSNYEICRNVAGYDCSRALSPEGTLFFKFPPLGSYKFRHEIFGVPRVSGRATHVYEIEVAAATPGAEDSSVAVEDPPNLRPKLLSSHNPMQSGGFQQAHHRMTRRSENPKRTMKMPRRSPTRPLEMPSLDLGPPDSPPVQPTLSDSEPVQAVRLDAHEGEESWEYFCTNWTSGFRDDASRKYLLNPSKPIVMKISWVPYERLNIEIKVLMAVVGHFGFVRYLGHVTIPHDGMERLEYFLEASASEDWRCQDWPNVYTSPDVRPVLFRRVHRAVYYSNTGSSLVEYAHDIIVIAFSLKDAYIALYILFTLGFLHRDPSIGNILTLDKYVRITDKERKYLRELFGEELFTKWGSMLELQRAFLCDFDQAVEWKVKREHLPGRSATPAFLASARSTAWVLGIRFLETLPDDLEAATWTGFYSALRAANAASNKPSALQIRHYETFNGDDAYVITAAKEWMLKLASSTTGSTKPASATRISEEEEVLQSALGETWPLWRRLFRAAVVCRAEINALKAELPDDENFCTAGGELQKKLEAVCKNALLRYLGAIFETLQEQPFLSKMPPIVDPDEGNNPPGDAGAPGAPDAPAPEPPSDPDGGNPPPPGPHGAAGAPGASHPPVAGPPNASRGAKPGSARPRGAKFGASSNPPPKRSSTRNKDLPQHVPSNPQDPFSS